MADISKVAKIAIVVLALSLTGIFFLRGRDHSNETVKADETLLSILGDNGIDEEDLLYKSRERRVNGRHTFLKIIRHYRAGGGFDEDEFAATVKERVAPLGFKFAKSLFEKEEGGDSFTVFLSFKSRILYELKFLKKRYRAIKPLKPNGGKIAVVLDDFGYNTDNLDTLFGIDLPMTISVLPNLPYSKRIAEEAGNRDFEVILHLPLEPHGRGVGLEEGTIMVDMPAEEANGLLVEAIRAVPGAKGVSNHMGSKATESQPFMRQLFKELKKHDLYFIDNVVTDRSVCRKVALEVGLRAASRSVFLDNESDESYIEKQILYTAELAAKTGWAIGTGHDRINTIKVLARVLPQLEEAGFKFVYVSELAK